MTNLLNCGSKMSLAGRLAALHTLKILAVSLGLMAMNTAYAVDDGWYLGLGLGLGAHSKNETTIACDLRDIECVADEVDIAAKLMGGYQFNRNFALEFGFADWGEATVDEAQDSLMAFNASGVYLSVIPELPLGEYFSIFAELGVTMMNTEVKFAKDGYLHDLLGSGSSKDVWAPVYGLGVAANIKHWTIRLQWERIDPSTDHKFDDIKIAAPKLDVYGLSLIYRF